MVDKTKSWFRANWMIFLTWLFLSIFIIAQDPVMNGTDQNGVALFIGSAFIAAGLVFSWHQSVFPEKSPVQTPL